MSSPDDEAWQAVHDDALSAAALFAVDPVGLGGVALHALPGPARDGWLALATAR